MFGGREVGCEHLGTSSIDGNCGDRDGTCTELVPAHSAGRRNVGVDQLPRIRERVGEGADRSPPPPGLGRPGFRRGGVGQKRPSALCMY